MLSCSLLDLSQRRNGKGKAGTRQQAQHLCWQLVRLLMWDVSEQEEEEEVFQAPVCERENGEDGVYGGKLLSSRHSMHTERA